MFFFIIRRKLVGIMPGLHLTDKKETETKEQHYILLNLVKNVKQQ